MEDLKITGNRITWKESKVRNGKKVVREYKVMKHQDHISILKELTVEGKSKDLELVHIPIKLLPEILKFTNVKN